MASTGPDTGRPVTAPTASVPGSRRYDLDGLNRAQLASRSGVEYLEFRRSLTPRYARVWAQLGAGYAALVAIAAGIVIVRGTALTWWAVPVGGLVLGYVIAYIELFLHEAAHYNLARSKAGNDTVANLLVGSLVGQEIAAYRLVHLGHHRHLGTPADPERTYFDPLNVRFLVEALLGVRVARVMANQRRLLRQCDDRGPGSPRPAQATHRRQLALGLLVNGAVVVGAAALGWWTLAAGWVVAMLVFFPFFASVRQLLEHRGNDARREVDYRVVPHGAVTRLFGGPLGATLGGAGFNRHLLHHWEPGISCTRLRELEGFLLETGVAPQLSESRTTYLATFVCLFGR